MISLSSVSSVSSVISVKGMVGPVRVICATMMLVLGAPVATQDTSPGVESFNRFFNEINTLEAQFTQIVLDENMAALDDGHGTVWIKRPGRFRWNYAPPDAQEIVGDGERVWLYDIALEQITVRNQAEALGRAPAILLAGFTEVRIGFEANRPAIDGIGRHPRSTHPHQFRQPQGNESLVEQIFQFIPPDGVDVIDQSGE